MFELNLIFNYEFWIALGLSYIVIEMFLGAGYFISLALTSFLTGLIQYIFEFQSFNVLLAIYIPFMFIGLFITHKILKSKNDKIEDINEY
jgi:membrane protein implicated in regulation of membrane protease activity